MHILCDNAIVTIYRGSLFLLTKLSFNCMWKLKIFCKIFKGNTTSECSVTHCEDTVRKYRGVCFKSLQEDRIKHKLLITLVKILIFELMRKILGTLQM